MPKVELEHLVPVWPSVQWRWAGREADVPSPGQLATGTLGLSGGRVYNKLSSKGWAGVLTCSWLGGAKGPPLVWGSQAYPRSSPPTSMPLILVASPPTPGSCSQVFLPPGQD